MEALYTEGPVKFYESCSLDSIKNAVSKFTERGILTRTSIT
jgi:hypothetical protein